MPGDTKGEETDRQPYRVRGPGQGQTSESLSHKAECDPFILFSIPYISVAF